MLVSCGDFDGNQLSRESEFKNFKLRNYLKRWINLKKVFNSTQTWTKMNDIKHAKPTTTGMEDMLQKCGLKLEGRHHSGIDDAKNIASIVIHMLKSGFKFN